jgi:hypothetical protein
MLDTSKIKKEILRLRHNRDISDYAETSLLAEVKGLENQSTHSWVKYSWENPVSHPPAYGSYFVHRKDGKIHWETWNGAGWAYNEKVITYWAKITMPKSI